MKALIAKWKGIIHRYNGNCCSVHLNQELCCECGGCILCGDGKENCPVCS